MLIHNMWQIPFGCYTLGCWYKYTVTVMYWIICILSIDCMSSQRTGRWQLEMLSFLEKLWGLLVLQVQAESNLSEGRLFDGSWIGQKSHWVLWKARCMMVLHNMGYQGNVLRDWMEPEAMIQCWFAYSEYNAFRHFPSESESWGKYRMSQFPLDRHGGTVSLAVM